MAFNKHGSPFHHLIRCYDDKTHWVETRGMWFDLDEKVCPYHGDLATVLKSNLREVDKQQYERGNK